MGPWKKSSPRPPKVRLQPPFEGMASFRRPSVHVVGGPPSSAWTAWQGSCWTSTHIRTRLLRPLQPSTPSPWELLQSRPLQRLPLMEAAAIPLSAGLSAKQAGSDVPAWGWAAPFVGWPGCPSWTRLPIAELSWERGRGSSAANGPTAAGTLPIAAVRHSASRVGAAIFVASVGFATGALEQAAVVSIDCACGVPVAKSRCPVWAPFSEDLLVSLGSASGRGSRAGSGVGEPSAAAAPSVSAWALPAAGFGCGPGRFS